MELADFIHLSGDTLTLIHAKGANTNAPDRQISVSSFEVVVSQALKSLRWLDETNLKQGLLNGLKHKVGKSVWQNGQPDTRENFLKALGELGSRFRKKVVILQPQVTNLNLQRGEAADQGPELVRYQQLMTLLNAASATCHGLGAELWVVGQTIAHEAALVAQTATA